MSPERKREMLEAYARGDVTSTVGFSSGLSPHEKREELEMLAGAGSVLAPAVGHVGLQNTAQLEHIPQTAATESVHPIA
ncbi:MAG: hypothetical protein JWO35_53 [Candidatus Saccharibacteria bacterium]|nr:hypothetical protein [Candidatus Saccharibacteria bacterium]